MISWFLNPSPSANTNIIYLRRHQGTWNKSRKYGIFFANTMLVNMGIFVFEQFESIFTVFRCLFSVRSLLFVFPFSCCCCLNFWHLMFYQTLWRWAPGNDQQMLNKISKIMDMNFISIKKKHEWKFGKSCKLFYFQVREYQ